MTNTKSVRISEKRKKMLARMEELIQAKIGQLLTYINVLNAEKKKQLGEPSFELRNGDSADRTDISRRLMASNAKLAQYEDALLEIRTGKASISSLHHLLCQL